MLYKTQSILICTFHHLRFEVSHIFKHKTVGFDINYVLVRIVLLHEDPVSVSFSNVRFSIYSWDVGVTACLVVFFFYVYAPLIVRMRDILFVVYVLLIFTHKDNSGDLYQMLNCYDGVLVFCFALMAVQYVVMFVFSIETPFLHFAGRFNVV